jgi:hypothetical protein
MDFLAGFLLSILAFVVVVVSAWGFTTSGGKPNYTDKVEHPLRRRIPPQEYRGK